MSKNDPVYSAKGIRAVCAKMKKTFTIVHWIRGAFYRLLLAYAEIRKMSGNILLCTIIDNIQMHNACLLLHYSTLSLLEIHTA